ncbi:MAG: cytochrome ubiquinol oxidase subunit I [Candidatus Rokubacteria bacterium]|nr:cytochrome ubiquinol oxidase subunit I [Candidatus Rokubacteria bacterium]MBI3104201.1 cytochrome ubiquinol oxidase subunit I [Candidatus Rokubacteria bacterium]
MAPGRAAWLLITVLALALGSALAGPAAAAEAPATDYRRFFGGDARLVIWIVAQIHLMFGAFVLGVPIFASIVEVIGWRTGDSRYDRLAQEFTALLAAAFSTTAAFGGLLAFALFGLYPRFMTFLTSIFHTTYYVYALLFLAETFTLYLYYYGWNRLRGRWKGLHVLLGILLNVWGTVLMLLANAWVSYMMAPSGLDKEALRFVGTTWQAVANPLWIPLAIHRFVANVAFGGFIVGAYAALRFLGARRDADRAYYDWMGYVGNFVGLAALIPLPFAGYYLGREVYSASPVMGNNMMGGAFSWSFIIQAVLIGMLFVGGNYYLWTGMGRISGAERYRPYIKYINVLLLVSFAVWLTPRNIPLTGEEQLALGGQFHPLLKYLGLMAAKNAAVNFIILSTFFSFLLYRRANKGRPRPFAEHGAGAKVTLGVAAAISALILAWYGRSLLTLDPTTLDLSPDRARYFTLPAYLLLGQVGMVLVTGVLTLRDRGKLAQALFLASTVLASVFVLGVYGFVIMEKANPFLRNIAVGQWLMVMVCLFWTATIDVLLFRRAEIVGEIRWGRMPARSQYALVLLCVSIVMLMGLMGFIRSGLREDWHIYGVLQDTSTWAWTPTNAYMMRVVGSIVVVFLGLVSFVFWLAGLGQHERGDERPA